MGKAGRRELVQVLRLQEVFLPEEVEAGAGEAPRLNLGVYAYLPRARLADSSARADLELLTGSRI